MSLLSDYRECSITSGLSVTWNGKLLIRLIEILTPKIRSEYSGRIFLGRIPIQQRFTDIANCRRPPCSANGF
jgi:hypothetical protein